MSLLKFFYWTATILTLFIKNGFKLLKEKAFKIISKYGRNEAQNWPQGSKENNNFCNCITFQVILALYFKILSVVLSGLLIIRNLSGETYFYHLYAYLLACSILNSLHLASILA